MSRPALSLALALAVLIPARAADSAPEAAQAADLLRGLAGSWSGELTYKDYESGERTSLKLNKTVTLLPDGATLQVLAAYDDGPAGIVTIVSLQGLAEDGQTWQSAAFRKGEDRATGDARLTLPSAPAGPTRWTIVTLEDGTDGGHPATIRETITRNGDQLTTLTEYDRTDDDVSAFAFRNEEVLVRAP